MSITPFRALSILMLSSAVSVSMAQTPKPEAPKESEYITTKEFRSKVFVLKYRSSGQIQQILRPLGSGFNGATMSSTDRDGLNVLTVRDFPENLATIEEALKRLDVPSTTPKEVEFHIHILFASKTPAPSEEFPEELKDVLGTLKSTLQYKSYTLVASFVQRASAGANNLRGMGDASIPAPASKGDYPFISAKFNWNIGEFKLDTPAEGPSNLKLNRFELGASTRSANESGDAAHIHTDLNLKDGEKVVVGTSTIKDKGLIVVLTAKVLK